MENRQKIGSDANCPSSGILIMYADDTVCECPNVGPRLNQMDANLNVPYINDAADIGKKICIDTENNLALILQEKNGLPYKILVTADSNARK